MSRKAQINYTKRDYESTRSALINKIPSITEEWTDRNYSDLGIVLLELFVGVGDMLQYYLDRKANEGFPETARERINVIRGCRLVGYELSRQATASTRLRFSLESAHGFDIEIPLWTSCQTADTESPIRFVTWEVVTITAGELQAEVNARQGEIKTETFTGTGVTDQIIKLSDTAITEIPLVITVDGNSWAEVDHLVDSDPDSKYFRVETDEEGYLTVHFGDGVSGAIPGTGEEIIVKYLSTIGPDGNMGSNLITVVADEIRDVEGTPVNLLVTNIEAASGGSAEEGIDEAKRNAPAALKAMFRMSDPESIKTLILAYPGVARVQVVDRNSSSSIVRYYRIKVYVAPSGGGDIPSLLRSDLDTFIQSRKIRPMDITVEQAVYKVVDITAKIYVLNSHDQGVVKNAVSGAISDYFDFVQGEIDFGDGITTDQITAVIDQIEGVSYSELSSPSAALACEDGEILRAGTISITVGGVV